MRKNAACISAWLTDEEHAAFMRLAIRNNVTIAAYLRAIVIDVLYEEGLLGRIEHTGRSQASESREASGTATQ